MSTTECGLATIVSVRHPLAGRVLYFDKLMGNLAPLLLLAATCAGFAMIGFGVHQLLPPSKGIPSSGWVEAQRAGTLLYVLGIALYLSSLVGVIFLPWFSALCLLRSARCTFANRGDRVVNPYDAKAIFVRVVPREHWKRWILQPTTDVGFLLPGTGEHLFEGDKERYSIPEKAVVACEIDQQKVPSAVLLRVVVASGAWREFPLFPVSSCLLNTARRRECRARPPATHLEHRCSGHLVIAAGCR